MGECIKPLYAVVIAHSAFAHAAKCVITSYSIHYTKLYDGMGNYHGIQGFDTFSHTKSVLKQNFLFDVPLRYAPYKKKLGLIKMILK